MKNICFYLLKITYLFAFLFSFFQLKYSLYFLKTESERVNKNRQRVREKIFFSSFKNNVFIRFFVFIIYVFTLFLKNRKRVSEKYLFFYLLKIMYLFAFFYQSDNLFLFLFPIKAIE